MSMTTFPFFSDWDKRGVLPDFAAIKPEMFVPAFRQAMAEHKAEVDAILNNPAPATFDNTMVPLELAGRNLTRVSAVFGIVSGTMSSKQIQAIEEEISPELSRHGDEIAFHPKLFPRIDVIFQSRAALEPEARRLVEEKHRDLVLAGALLPQDKKDRLIAIGEKTSELETKFGNNLMNQVDEAPLIIADKAALAGVDEDTLKAMAEAAAKLGKAGYAVRLQREVVEPILVACTVRETRRLLHEAFTNRCNNNDDYDNKAIIPELLALRQEQASILGFKSFAHQATVANMAKTPEAALGLMTDLWEPAKQAMARDQAELQAAAAADGINDALKPWDWIYYAEKVRQQKYALDEAELKPYLSLANVRDAAFRTAERLFDIELRPVAVQGWHPDVEAFNVVDRKSGQNIALFLTDYIGREGKQSGAWMGEIASFHQLEGGQKPIVYNVCNYSKPAPGKPCLLTLDNARTIFHEFGHGLHGMLTRARFPSLAGTGVYRDFVELPSQLFEHWLTEPVVMKEHLRHVETGQPIPDALIDKIKKAEKFDSGFEQVRYLSSTIMDLELHQKTDVAGLDIAKAEREILTRYGMPDAGQMMHRPMHHGHLFSSSYYAAGYYVYGWAAVLDHDAFAAFEEKGNPFDKDAAAKLREHIYSAGNTEDPAVLYEKFRGRGPDRTALLRNKGFIAA